MIDWSSKNIDISQGKRCGNDAVKTFCPECHEGRKASHRRERELLCLLDKGWFHCYNCGWQGFATVLTDEEKEAWLKSRPGYRDYKTHKKEQPKREYTKPPKPATTELDARTVAWFAEKRGISEATLKKMGVTTSEEWMPKSGKRRMAIHFNYYRDGELVSVKMRDGNKEFKQIGGCEQIAYNLDGIKNTEDCYIVEGEMDALSLVEIGYTNVVSVPTGASDGTMHWLVDYFEEYFAMKKVVYICSDNDEPGQVLQRNLVKHFDPGQYVLVTDWGVDPATGKPNKDANDCLVHNGAVELRKRLSEGKTVHPEGDADMAGLGEDLDELYYNGLPTGLPIGWKNLDEYVHLEKGRLVIITGTPGSGKSQFLDHIAILMNRRYGWRFSMFSPEMMPLGLHLSMLVSKITGKPFNRYSIDEPTYRAAKERAIDAVHFIDPEDYDIDNILSIARYQVRKYGCDALVLDPWNDLTMDGEGITKTDVINTALLKILTFAQKQQVVCFVMAHPSKIGRNKDGTTPEPTLSDISGSIHFYNRADIGIVLVRVNEDGREYTKVKIQKMRFANLGKVGETYMRYQVGVGRFHPYDPVTDSTDWDERNYLEPERVLPTNDTDDKSEANVQGFLAQAERADRQSGERKAANEDEDMFKEDGDAPF